MIRYNYELNAFNNLKKLPMVKASFRDRFDIYILCSTRRFRITYNFQTIAEVGEERELVLIYYQI